MLHVDSVWVHASFLLMCRRYYRDLNPCVFVKSGATCRCAIAELYVLRNFTFNKYDSTIFRMIFFCCRYVLYVQISSLGTHINQVQERGVNLTQLNMI